MRKSNIMQFGGIGVLVTAVAMLVIGVFFLHPVKVPAGNVGVKVYLLGGKKGVDHEVVGVGRYFLTINQDMYKFPTFTQNYVWTKDPTEGSKNDESITFQTMEGMSVNADVGISYAIMPDKVGHVFQKYRRGVDEITDTFLRNMVRDAFVRLGSNLPVESVYGTGKSDLINKVEAIVREQVADIGINIEQIYLIGDMRLPPQVITALNTKIEATQMAERRRNEVAQTEAEADKVRAQAAGIADAKLLDARAEAEANRVVSASLTPQLVQYYQIKQWDGVLPKFTGGGVIPMLNVAGQ